MAVKKRAKEAATQNGESSAAGSGDASDEKDEFLVAFGRKVREARIAAGMSQQDLSEAIGGSSQSHIYLIEIGKKAPTIETLRKLADALDLDPRDLLPERKLGQPSEATLKELMGTIETAIQSINRLVAEVDRLDEFRTYLATFVEPAKSSPRQ